eukprot:jgi/Ulvmu1/11179/UM072_0015.1
MKLAEGSMKKGVKFGVTAASMAAQSCSGLTHLDDGSLGLVMAGLPARDVCAVALTCKTLSAAIIRQDGIWRQMLIDLLPFQPHTLPKNAPSAQRWYYVVKHYCTSLRCPSNKVAEAAATDTAAWVTGGDPAMPAITPLHPLYYRKSLRLPSLYADPDVSVNPIFSWNCSMQLRDAFTLRAHPNLSSDTRGGGGRRRVAAAVIRRLFPFSHEGTAVVGAPAVRYVEVEVVQLPPGSQLSVGAIHDRAHMRWMRADVPLGHYSGNWAGSFSAAAWDACGGRIYPGPIDTQWHSRGAPFTGERVAVGTVLGCGMDILSNRVFFTCNGAVVGTAHPCGRTAAAGAKSCTAGARGGGDDGVGAGGAWGDSSSSGGSSVAGGGPEQFLESLMSLRRSSASFGLETAGADLPAGTLDHPMHALDVAHSLFAVSLQGGAAVRVNLGQAPFRFDLGTALAPPAPRRGAGRSVAGDADDCASVASSAGALSLGGGAAGRARAWRASVGGGSARSSIARGSRASSDGEAAKAAAAAGGGDGVDAATSDAADRLAASLRQLARDWSSRSYGSELNADVRAALHRLGSDLGRRDSAVGGGLEGVLAWLGIRGSAHE